MKALTCTEDSVMAAVLCMDAHRTAPCDPHSWMVAVKAGQHQPLLPHHCHVLFPAGPCHIAGGGCQVHTCRHAPSERSRPPSSWSSVPSSLPLASTLTSRHIPTFPPHYIVPRPPPPPPSPSAPDVFLTSVLLSHLLLRQLWSDLLYDTP